MAIADILTNEIKKSDQHTYERSEIINVGKAIEKEYKSAQDINTLKTDIEAASLEATVLDAIKNANTKEFGKESNASRFKTLGTLVEKLLGTGGKFESKGVTLVAKDSINYFVAGLKIIGAAAEDQLKAISQNALFAKSEQSDRETLKSLCNSCDAGFDMNVLKAIMYFQSMVGEYKQGNPAYGVDGIAGMYTLNALNAVLEYLDTGKKPAKVVASGNTETTSDATVSEKTTTLPKGKAEDLDAKIAADASFDIVAYTAEAKYVKYTEKKEDTGEVLSEYVGMMKNGQYEGQGTIVRKSEKFNNTYYGVPEGTTKFVGEFKEDKPWIGKLTRKNATSGKLETIERTYGVEIDKAKILNTTDTDFSTFTGYARYESKLSDGSIERTYQGYRLNGKFEGKGKISYYTGGTYEGEFKDGLKEGQGTYTRADGDVYKGEFKDDLKDGQGTYTRANGAVYKGEFKDDLIEGQGTYTRANGAVYKGECAGGNRNGQGTLVYVDGAKTIGIRQGNEPYNAKKTDKSGKMIEEYVNGTKVELVDGKLKALTNDEAKTFTGRAKYEFKDANDASLGYIYEGDRLDGKFHGKGKYTETGAADMASYEGQRNTGEYDGEGKLIMKDGSKKIGYFKNGVLRVGKEFDDKGKVIAEYKENKRMVPPKLEERKLTTKGLTTTPAEDMKKYSDAVEKSKNDATTNITKLITKYKNDLCYWDDKEKNTYMDAILAVMRTQDYDLNGTGGGEQASRFALAQAILLLAKKAGLGINAPIAKRLLDKAADEDKNIDYGKDAGGASALVLKTIGDEIIALRTTQKKILKTMNAEVKKVNDAASKFENATYDPKNMISLGGMTELSSIEFDDAKRIISVVTKDGVSQQILLGNMNVDKKKDNMYALSDPRDNYMPYYLVLADTSFDIKAVQKGGNRNTAMVEFDERDIPINIKLDDIVNSLKETVERRYRMDVWNFESTGQILLTQTSNKNTYKLNITDKGNAVAIEQHVDETIKDVNKIVDIKKHLNMTKTDVDKYFKEQFYGWESGLARYDILYLKGLLAVGNKEATFGKLDVLRKGTKTEIEKNIVENVVSKPEMVKFINSAIKLMDVVAASGLKFNDDDLNDDATFKNAEFENNRGYFQKFCYRRESDLKGSTARLKNKLLTYKNELCPAISEANYKKGFDGYGTYTLKDGSKYEGTFAKSTLVDGAWTNTKTNESALRAAGQLTASEFKSMETLKTLGFVQLDADKKTYGLVAGYQWIYADYEKEKDYSIKVAS